MGGQLGETHSEASQSIKTYFFDLYAYFISIGMSHDEFWNDDVELINSYVKAEEIRQTKLNNQMWIQGYYNQMAIASCLAKNVKYPKEPIPMTEKEVEDAKKQRVENLKKVLIAKSKK